MKIENKSLLTISDEDLKRIVAYWKNDINTTLPGWTIRIKNSSAGYTKGYFSKYKQCITLFITPKTTAWAFTTILIHELHHKKWTHRKRQKHTICERQVEEATLKTLAQHQIPIPIWGYKVKSGFARRLENKYGKYGRVPKEKITRRGQHFRKEREKVT